MNGELFDEGYGHGINNEWPDDHKALAEEADRISWLLGWVAGREWARFTKEHEAAR